MSNFIIEEERGTITRSAPRHNGYFAGAFSSTPTKAELTNWFRWGQQQSVRWNAQPAPGRTVASISNRG